MPDPTETQPSPIRLTDVVPDPAELREFPLRSLCALFDCVTTGALQERVMQVFGTKATNLLAEAQTARLQGLSEDECRGAVEAFVRELGDLDPFLEMLDQGQLELAQVISLHVADRRRWFPDALEYTPEGLRGLCPSCDEDLPKPDSLQPSAYGDPPPGGPYDSDAPRAEGKLDLETWRRRLEVWEVAVELRTTEREISELDRPGWPKTPEQQASLERLRARRLALRGAIQEDDAPDPLGPDAAPELFLNRDPKLDAEQWRRDFDRLCQISPMEAARVAFTWQRRASALGWRGTRARTILANGAAAREAFYALAASAASDGKLLHAALAQALRASKAVDALSSVLAEVERELGRDAGGSTLRDAEGLLRETIARLDACRSSDGPPAESPPDGVRYLSADERGFLLLCARPGSTYFRRSELAERMREAGLVRPEQVGPSSRAWRTTPAGTAAIETWRYRVDAG